AADPERLAYGRPADRPGRDHRAAGAAPGRERDARLPRVQPPDARRRAREGDQGRARARPLLQAARLRPGDRSLMARTRTSEPETNGNVAVEDYSPRLKDAYLELRPQLKEQLGVSSVMQVPRIQKI